LHQSLQGSGISRHKNKSVISYLSTTLLSNPSGYSTPAPFDPRWKYRDSSNGIGLLCPKCSPNSKSLTRSPLSLFSVYLQSIKSSHNIFKLTKLLNSIITVEKPKEIPLSSPMHEIPGRTVNTFLAVSNAVRLISLWIAQNPENYVQNVLCVLEPKRQIIRANLLTKILSSPKIRNDLFPKQP